MRLPLEFYNHLRDAVRISDIVRLRILLTKKGNEYLGVCPFHDEKTPSFTVNDIKKFYHCFGCGAHGDVIRFVSETYGISYKDSAIKIAEENGIELPKLSPLQERAYEEADQIYNILELAAQFFVSNLSLEVRDYLGKRGIEDSTINDFAIGYAPGGGELERFFEKKSIPLKDLLKSGLFGKKEDGRIYEVFNKRIMFPIRNSYNKMVAFGGRAIGDAMPKYINSPETVVFKKSETMYGENLATSHAYKDNYSILVEGYMDVIALHQAGFKQAVACLGTAVTQNHIQRLWRTSDEIIACLDGDNAGIRASSKIIDLVMPSITADKSVSFIQLPASLDPDDLIKSGGKASFQKVLNDRIGLSEMIWKKEFLGKNFKTAESRASLEKVLDGYSSLVKDNTLRANFRRYFKDMIWTNLIRKKSSMEYKKSSIPSELYISKKYSEIEFSEFAICAFMVKFPQVVLGAAEDLRLVDQELNDFKEWVVEFINIGAECRNITLEEEVKNSRFYNTYLVLSGPNNLFLDTSFFNKTDIDQKLAFELLCKKHYLLLLKQEYVEVSKGGFDDAQSKSFSYLKEIQKISKELIQLSEKFIN
ncbi:DNA primase [Candidatus Megaera venefica]|uniref:DNA primase n=1 Tax=Candidatus Megaera venefica TaxID=2055910 RepID=A0ABU5NAJ4_9RICK|nr:DNA primase [Candidatus Megaera venefica]MEA0970197.1 DNA primase [Candidatus Megaera venefica]